MKILLINNLFPPGFIGGYELGAYDAADYLHKCGHNVSVLTSQTHLAPQKCEYDFVVRRSLRCVTWDVEQNSYRTIVSEGLFHSSHNIRVIKDFIEEQGGFDVALCFNLSGLGTFSIINFLSMLSIPTSVYLMDNIFVDARNPFMSADRFIDFFGVRRALEEVKWISMSRTLLNEVAAYAGFRLKDSIIIPGWAEVPSTEEQLIFASSRERLQRETTKFVYCSRISPSKGIFHALNACVKLLNAEKIQFELDVFGNGDVDELLRFIDENDLQEHVKYRGEVTKLEMQVAFRGYDALVFPTWSREPFGFVAAEAAAQGCVPILTAGTGASEWFIDRIDCLKISQDTDSLYQAMVQFISMPERVRREMRCAAQRTVTKYLSKNHILSRIEAELEGSIEIKRDTSLSLAKAEAVISIISSQWKWLHQ